MTGTNISNIFNRKYSQPIRLSQLNIFILKETLQLNKKERYKLVKLKLDRHKKTTPEALGKNETIHTLTLPWNTEKTRQLEKLQLKAINKMCSIMFKKTCLSNN